MLATKELNWLNELQYALSLSKRKDRIFQAVFHGVNFSDGNPTKEEFQKLIRKLYTREIMEREIMRGEK